MSLIQHIVFNVVSLKQAHILLLLNMQSLRFHLKCLLTSLAMFLEALAAAMGIASPSTLLPLAIRSCQSRL